MKYTISGTFITGDRWEESANNKRELKFVLDKAYGNTCVNNGSVKVSCNEKVLKTMFGEVHYHENR